MSSAPQFASTPNIGVATISSSANTAYASPGATGNIPVITSGINGIKIEQIDVIAGTTTAANLNLWLYNQSTYFLLDTFPLATVTTSTTVPLPKYSHYYSNLWLPPLVAPFTATGTPTSGSYTVTSSAAFGGVAVGQSISGTDILAGTIVTAVASSSSITISQPASASPGAETLTFGQAWALTCTCTIASMVGNVIAYAGLY